MTEIANSAGGLLDELQMVAEPCSNSRGLPNAVYCDEQLFAFERDEVLGRSWVAVGYGSELPGPGFAKTIDLMGMPLLAVRDASGELQIFHNVCSHRGMKLLHEDDRLRNVIRCPYHS